MIPIVTDGATVVVWLASDGRHDIRSGVDVVNALVPDEENHVLRAQLEAGIAALIAARDAAQADIAIAEAMRAAADTYGTQAQALAATAFTAAPTYSATQMQALADALKATANRQAVILDALASILAWRAAVDRNAVDTDTALIWLGQLAGANLTS